MYRMILSCIILGIVSINGSAAEPNQPMIVNIKRLSVDVAQKIAQAALLQCRKEGVQVAVTVVDRGGHAQVVLRDVLAMPITLEVSQLKANTAMSFNSKTSDLEGRFKGSYSVAKIDSIVIAAGGVPIQAGGTILGGVGVSGAPSGKTDEKCAESGVNAVLDDLEMGSDISPM